MNQKEPEVDLESEYLRILDYESIYLEKWVKWKKISIVTYVIFFIFVPLAFWSFLNWAFSEILDFIPFVLFFSVFVFSYFFSRFADRKVIDIENKFGLQRDELLYLRVYETSIIINHYLNEANTNRKQLHKNEAIEIIKEIIRQIDLWDYGNISFIKEFVGVQIDLLKDNLRRLVLPNVAIGDIEPLKKLHKILLDFCEYLLSPSIEKFNTINVAINVLPYRKYEVFTRKDKMKRYFRKRLLLSRLIFSFIISIVAGIGGLYLGLEIGVLYAGILASFFGSLASFDKIFTIKKEV